MFCFCFKKDDLPSYESINNEYISLSEMSTRDNKNNDNNSIVDDNHREIEEMNATRIFKILCHYFEVINNGGYIKNVYNGNLKTLNNNIKLDIKSGERCTSDEQLCIDILNNEELSMEELLKKVKHWGLHRGKGTLHEEMVDMGLADNWSNKEMIGQLWQLYNDLIDG